MPAIFHLFSLFDDMPFSSLSRFRRRLLSFSRRHCFADAITLMILSPFHAMRYIHYAIDRDAAGFAIIIAPFSISRPPPFLRSLSFSYAAIKHINRFASFLSPPELSDYYLTPADVSAFRHYAATARLRRFRQYFFIIFSRHIFDYAAISSADIAIMLIFSYFIFIIDSSITLITIISRRFFISFSY
jgi:hypothetical protein